MILVCGGLADGVTELVCARLQHSGYPYRLLDLAHYPADYRVAWRWTAAGPDGTIAGPDWILDLDEITGVYVRFLGPEGRLPPKGVPEDAAALQFEADAGLMALLDDLPCPVVNRVGGGMSNNSKPYQSLLLRRAGLEVPATLVTSDAEAVRAFQAEYGDVIYKSASGIRSIVRRLGPDQVARLAFLRYGLAQFQAFVPGRNVRVHTVGDAVFATLIETEAVDYRYAYHDGLDVAMTPVSLPAAVEDACLRAARDLDLLFAGIDLKETPDGEYVCFEVNPCPGFIYYERHTGQQISTALADLLNGTVRTVRREPARQTNHSTRRENEYGRQRQRRDLEGTLRASGRPPRGPAEVRHSSD
jgi:glutathione synthase/RimK-type ligase-like ATP-grasp enzyme